MVLWAGFCIVLFRGSRKEHDVRFSAPLPVVIHVSIDVFSSFTTNIKKERDPSRGYRTRESVTSLRGVRRWNRVDDLEDGRIIGIAKSLRNGPLQHRPEPFQTTCRQCITGGFPQKELHVFQEMTCGKVRILIGRVGSRGSFFSNAGANKALSRKIAMKVSIGTPARCTNPRLRAKADISAAIN
jgi:hypothetical protein